MNIFAETELLLAAAAENADDAVSGVRVLDDVRDAIAKYVVLGSPHDYVAVTLWIGATHAVRSFEHATRLAVHSAVKRCGKSRLLEVIEALSHQPISTTNISVPALFRVIEAGGDDPPTLLLDEADRLFGSVKSDDDNRELIGLLNNGFRRGAETWRCVGPQQTPTRFSNYAMCVVAGIGRKPDTIEDRAVNLVMRRRLPGEVVAKFRQRTDRAILSQLRERLAAWAESQTDVLGQPVLGMPPQLEDRAEDAWEPLLAIADAAGGRWPALARAAAIQLCADAVDADAHLSDGIRLLADLADVFDRMVGVSFLKTNVLLDELRKVEDAPWGESVFSARALALRLAKFDLRPRHNDTKTARGYHRRDFADVFHRYLPSSASEASKTPLDLQKRSDGSKILDGSYRPGREPTDTWNRPEKTDRPSKTAGQKGYGTVGTDWTGTPTGDDKAAS